MERQTDRDRDTGRQTERQRQSETETQRQKQRQRQAGRQKGNRDNGSTGMFDHVYVVSTQEGEELLDNTDQRLDIPAFARIADEDCPQRGRPEGLDGTVPGVPPTTPSVKPASE